MPQRGYPSTLYQRKKNSRPVRAAIVIHLKDLNLQLGDQLKAQTITLRCITPGNSIEASNER